MKKAFVVSIITPKKCLLDGLWFGPRHAKNGFIFVHGLGSSVFSQQKPLPAGDSIMAMYFNNSGHDEMTSIKRVNDKLEKGYDYKPGGMAHEIFTDCVDDIPVSYTH